MHEQLHSDVQLLRFMVCELREKQSAVLSDLNRSRCKDGITALENAIEALTTQVYA